MADLTPIQGHSLPIRPGNVILCHPIEPPAVKRRRPASACRSRLGCPCAGFTVHVPHDRRQRAGTPHAAARPNDRFGGLRREARPAAQGRVRRSVRRVSCPFRSSLRSGGTARLGSRRQGRADPRPCPQTAHRQGLVCGLAAPGSPLPPCPRPPADRRKPIASGGERCNDMGHEGRRACHASEKSANIVAGVRGIKRKGPKASPGSPCRLFGGATL